MLHRIGTVAGWTGLALLPLLVVTVTIAAAPYATVSGNAPLGPGTTEPARLAAAAAPAAASPLVGFDLELVVSGLQAPVDVAALPGDDRLLVVGKDGVVAIVTDGRILPEPFLDISTRIDTYAERGLLDVELHPDYASNGRLFVHYSDVAGNTRVAEYRSSDDPDRVLEVSERTILAVDQPHYYHNGGMLQIGPDGYLWMGLGDGGGIDDRFGNGQRPDTLLGAILRVDIDAATPYAIPPDNPFTAGGGAPEVWAYGLRNPWRFWIDPVSARIFVADVGQDTSEEIDVLSVHDGGANLGWPVWEGDVCRIEESCQGRFVAPTVTYPHQGTCAVIGGPVYRGSAIPELWGDYLFADYCAGWVRSLHVDGSGAAVWDDVLSAGEQITSFGVDGDGEVLVIAGDSLYRLIAVRSEGRRVP